MRRFDRKRSKVFGLFIGIDNGILALASASHISEDQEGKEGRNNKKRTGEE